MSKLINVASFKYRADTSSPWQELTLIGDVSALSDIVSSLSTLCLQAAVVTVSANGTTSHTLTGLTADHVIDNWGMFTDSACTTPIPENAPTADITITPGANSWTLLIENFSSTFYMKPTFILPQN